MHASVVMFRYRGDAIWYMQILKSTEWCYKGGEKLTSLIEWTLVVAFHSIQNSETLSLASRYIDYDLSWQR